MARYLNYHRESLSTLKKPKKNLNESGRISELQRYGILDTEAEGLYDDIVRLAACTCQTPMAYISLVDSDRQWFKSKIGLDCSQTPRNISFCDYTILEEEIMIIEDALEDPRFAESPLVTGEPHIRFYVGVPLQTPSGYNIGTLCVADIKPRKLTEEQIEALQALSRQVVALLELRFMFRRLQAITEEYRMIA